MQVVKWPSKILGDYNY